MFNAAINAVDAVLHVSLSRRIVLCSIRHYCKKSPKRLRVLEALEGLDVGSNITVQVQRFI